MPFTREGIYWKLDGMHDAPALVLLNSIGTDMDLWQAMVAKLRKRFLILRIDTRGHGASSAPSGDYSMADLAHDVASAMDGAGLASAIVAGVSLGGMIAMELALLQPTRVAALALVCTSATMDRASWGDRVACVRDAGMNGIVDLAMNRFLSPGYVFKHPEVAATIRRGLLTMNPQGYAGCGAAIRDMTLAERIEDIMCPSVVVTGVQDTSTPLFGHGDYLLGHIATARHVELDAAHLAPLEVPRALALTFVGITQEARA